MFFFYYNKIGIHLLSTKENTIQYTALNNVNNVQEGSSISRQNLDENLETLHLAPTLFYHLPGFNLKTGCLNPHPLSLNIVIKCS